MKKTISYLLLIALIFIYGCDKQLDKKPYTLYYEEFTDTEEGIDALLNGVYSLMQKTNYYGRLMYLYEGSKGPDFFVRLSSGNRFERENRYAETAQSGASGPSAWGALYRTIRNQTIVLENLPRISGNEANLRRIKGEAKALRALTYFDLMRLFAYPPLFSLPEGAKYNEKYRWGVPIISTVEQGTNIFQYEIRRELATTIFDFIEEELIDAISLLSNTSEKEGHINHLAASALLMRLYLYKGDWDKVIAVGDDINLELETRYRYISFSNYKTSYYKPFSPENVWELTYSIQDNLGGEALNQVLRKPTFDNPGAENDGQVSQNIGHAAFGMSNSARTLLRKHPDDVRSYLICDLGIANKTYYGYRKYIGEPYHYVYNIPIVRLPEIHLTLAEAYAEKEDYTNAAIYYNKVRISRTNSSGFTQTSKSGIINEILEERRRELMLEGHTFWDYFRRGLPINRVAIENIYASSTTVVFGDMVPVVFPIPLSEMEANQHIRDQQNPGYAEFQVI